MIQKIRNNAMGAFKHKKGFTLVEVIVVLVILAILAAILVPKLTGWINESKAKTATGEAHLVLSALQADCSEQYGKHTSADKFAYSFTATDKGRVDKYLSGDVSGTINSATGDETGKIIAFNYTASNGKIVTYNGTGFTVADKAPTT